MANKQLAYDIKRALFAREFVPYFQPQFNHATGMIVGAEVLARWIHPEKGLIPPSEFIPAMEESGQITKLDFYMFECAAKHIRDCRAKGITPVPLAVNFSRHDVIKDDFIPTLERIRQRYDIDSQYLKIEITESIAMENPANIKNIVESLNELGYIVEIDDFGSGYSSLNVLKDIDFDVIKLDMKFLSDATENKRAGIILDSVIRMAQWLGTQVIAEGVETMKQADYFKSVGCNYIQGYLYSRPLSSDDYIEVLKKCRISPVEAPLEMDAGFDSANFWDPESLDTLIFSSYVGPAAIFEYKNNDIRAIRVNEKYIKEMGMNMSEKNFVNADYSQFFDEENLKVFMETFDKAMDSGEEEECETWRRFTSECCGEEELCIRSTIKMIGRSSESQLFYVMVRNVTAEKLAIAAALKNEMQFKTVTEHANIYFWEYDIVTKEMRPCFRCMRDLGLPRLLKDYPESAIQSGIFPPEVADDYRAFMKEIDEGVGSKEAIFPLTVGRVPFHVRYTTEFDEAGRPVKAFGSATLVVDN